MHAFEEVQTTRRGRGDFRFKSNFSLAAAASAI